MYCCTKYCIKRGCGIVWSIGEGQARGDDDMDPVRISIWIGYGAGAWARDATIQVRVSARYAKIVIRTLSIF